MYTMCAVQWLRVRQTPHSLEAAKEVLRSHIQDGVLEELEDAFITTRNATVLVTFQVLRS
jgi:hypothetical protein